MWPLLKESIEESVGCGYLNGAGVACIKDR